MKAILVIDMPNKCYECPLMSKDMYCKAYANIVKGRKLCVEDDVLYGERNHGCPLKPLPQKKDFFEEYMKVDRNMRKQEFDKVQEELRNQIIGYNYCLDKILGEEDDR